MGLKPAEWNHLLAKVGVSAPVKRRRKPGEGRVGQSKRATARYATFPAWCVANGLPEPTAEHRVCADRRWRFDFAWPDAKVALEVEGGVWIRGRHSRGKGMKGDMAKYNRATVEGWRLIRVTPDELCTASTLGALRALLERQG